jgi:hypothetical protein
MKISEVQQTIFDETGIKTSVKKGTGSMRGYTFFRPMFQNGDYPKFSIEWAREFKERFPKCSVKPMFCSTTEINIYHGIEIDEPLKFKKESKPKSIEQMKVREWGSKNSQMRLDKTAARYAKKRRGAGGDSMVKYW